MHNYAPILITVYHRLEHFKKCIESLASCPEAKYTELYISSDFYRNNNEKPSVLGVRQYINKIKGFKNVTPFFFNENQGIENAFNYSINKIFEHHEDVIISEDDNVFSPLFLTYMNRMMNYYKNDRKVFAISGSSPNVYRKDYLPEKDELFATTSCDVWGHGLWKNRYMDFTKFKNSKNLIEELYRDISNKVFRKKLNDINVEYYPHFLYCVKNNKVPANDHLISYYCLKNNLFNIHNNNTYVKNFGFDGLGLNNRKNLKILKMIEKIEFSKSLPQPKNKLEFKNHLTNNYSNNKLKICFKVIIIKMGLFDYIKRIIKKIS